MHVQGCRIMAALFVIKFSELSYVTKALRAGAHSGGTD